MFPAADPRWLSFCCASGLGLIHGHRGAQRCPDGHPVPPGPRSGQAVEPPTRCSPSHPHLQMEEDAPLPKRRLHPCLKPTISQLCCCWMAEASPWTWLMDPTTAPGEPCPHGAGHRGRRQVAPPGDVTATAEIPALNTGCEEPAAAARHRALGSCSPSSLHRFPRHRWGEQPEEGGCSDREGFRQQKGNADRTVPPGAGSF